MVKNDLISRSALEAALRETKIGLAIDKGKMFLLIENAPPVDAVEVVHGRWEDLCRGKACYCSVCKGEFDNTCNEIHGEWKFCPNCGAKMDGGSR